MIYNDCIVICYPAGSGGSFMQGALRSIVKNAKFELDSNLGHCHASKYSTANFVSGDSLQSFNAELLCIESRDFDSGEVYANHYRNLIALQQRSIVKNVPMWFIKIHIDCYNSNEIEFVAQMLFRKTIRTFNLDLYDQIRDVDWPETAEKYLVWDPSGDKFLETVRHSLQSWYWVENYFTQDRTVCLTLRDIFLGDSIMEKISPWFTPEQMNAFSKLHQRYIETNQTLHSDLYSFLKN
jgi:hypothetical protein